MKIFWVMPFKNYDEGFCYKKGFFQGSISYHKRRRNVTPETKLTYHRVIYLVNVFKKCRVPFYYQFNVLLCLKKPAICHLFFSYKDKLSRSQNSEVTSLSCQLLEFSRHVFINLRKHYNIGKLTSLKH